MEKQGLILVHTGEGKGKTTAALGLAMRAWGGGLRILILQFIKGGWKYGELKTIDALNKIDGRIEIRQCGQGFSQRTDDAARKEEHRHAAEETLALAREEMRSGKWDMILLDEINYAVKFDLLKEEAVLSLLDEKPKEIHLILTGRDARESVQARADLVTEMTLRKHPYQKGIKAQQGIEF